MTYNFLNGKIDDSSMILPVMVSQGKGVRTTNFFLWNHKTFTTKIQKRITTLLYLYFRPTFSGVNFFLLFILITELNSKANVSEVTLSNVFVNKNIVQGI